MEEEINNNNLQDINNNPKKSNKKNIIIILLIIIIIILGSVIFFIVKDKRVETNKAKEEKEIDKSEKTKDNNQNILSDEEILDIAYEKYYNYTLLLYKEVAPGGPEGQIKRDNNNGSYYEYYYDDDDFKNLEKIIDKKKVLSFINDTFVSSSRAFYYIPYCISQDDNELYVTGGDLGGDDGDIVQMGLNKVLYKSEDLAIVELGTITCNNKDAKDIDSCDINYDHENSNTFSTLILVKKDNKWKISYMNDWLSTSINYGEC